MHIITNRTLKEYAETAPQARVALQDWHKKTQKADWSNLWDVKQTFNSVDYVGNSRYVFNIKGNHYRLIVKIVFQIKTVFIRWVGTHREYTRLRDIQNL